MMVQARAQIVVTDISALLVPPHVQLVRQESIRPRRQLAIGATTINIAPRAGPLANGAKPESTRTATSKVAPLAKRGSIAIREQV